MSEVQQVWGPDFLSHSSVNTGPCDHPEEKAFVCKSITLPALSQDICWHICHGTMVLSGFLCCMGCFPGFSHGAVLQKAFSPPPPHLAPPARTGSLAAPATNSPGVLQWYCGKSGPIRNIDQRCQQGVTVIKQPIRSLDCVKLKPVKSSGDKVSCCNVIHL